MDAISQIAIMLVGAIGINLLFRKYVKPITSWLYWFIAMFISTMLVNILSTYMVDKAWINAIWGPVAIQTLAIGGMLLFMPREPGKFSRLGDKQADKQDDKKKAQKPKTSQKKDLKSSDMPLKKIKKPKI
ncbi:MAG TPA: hypothetical protein VFF80_06975 [Bacillota bacterium]|nr:hypothetical protein [Bacillota bacterium]